MQALQAKMASTTAPTRSPTRGAEGLADFIPRITKGYSVPRHLLPLIALIERARVESIRAIVSMPPRHGKTETELHGIAWTLMRDPWRRVAFVGYAARFAEKQSRQALRIARRAGVPLAEDATSRKDWRTGVRKGGVWATSIDGQITGEGFDLVFIDDPIKNRAAAESATYRDTAYEAFKHDILTRIEPNDDGVPGSIIITQTRWHEEDLAGRLLKEGGWENICLPAIDDEGTPLWPERWPLVELERIREELGGPDGYGWSSLYQQRPIARGGALFGDASFYDPSALPRAGYRLSIGLDFAYSTRSQADYSVCVVLMEHAGVCYVLDVCRAKCAAPEFAATIARVRNEYQGASMQAFVGGTELGIVDMLGADPYNLAIAVLPAREDKGMRAQPVAAAWKAGKLLLPRSAPWLDPFLSELKVFTGRHDAHDDQVDALVSAYHPFAPSANTMRMTETDLDRFAKMQRPLRFSSSSADDWDD